MELVESEKRNYLKEKFKIELSGGELLMLLALSGESNSNAISCVVKDTYRESDFANTIYNKGLNNGLYRDLEKIHKKIKKGE